MFSRCERETERARGGWLERLVLNEIEAFQDRFDAMIDTDLQRGT